MIKNKQKTSLAPIEKVFLFAGLALIAVGCIANAYGAYVNMRFMHDLIDVLYYFHYVFLLIFGLLTGYALTNGSSIDRRLYNGVLYAILAVSLNGIIESVHFLTQGVLWNLPFPWGKFLFSASFLFAIILTFAIAVIARHKQPKAATSSITKWSVVAAFGAFQACLVATNLPVGSMDDLWMTIASYLTMPLVIAVIAYLVLRKIKTRSERFFYASLIASLYYLLITSVWQFWIDPTYPGSLTIALMTGLPLLVTAGLIWQARRATR